MTMDGTRSLTAMLATMPEFASMGEPLEVARRELISWGQALSQTVDAAHAGAVDQALRYLDGLACRVAVIGQVKAGKSSFINALVGRPHLLPSDVNPWTTVVTNLHFYHAVPPAESAVFTLFDNQEWSRIAESGGALRELTERLVPGFDPELLRRQLHAMRLRAEQRLGANFAAILGQHHSYPSITRDLLCRYVSAGAEQPESGHGLYSDVTKTADLFFAGDRVGFPVTIVDTPGTNDPLLVRDEITRQSLASADIYVVVLTAQQPLAIGDIALLRLLRGLHKERIIIFINRIDGLRDITDGAPRLVAHVEERLRAEFPNTRFPIIVGSARWATAALTADPAEIAGVADPALRAYALSRGAGQIEPNVPGRRPSAATLATLMNLSGLPRVTHAVGELMAAGNAAYAVRQLAGFFHELTRAGEATEHAQVRSLERAIGETRNGAENRQHELAAWKQELEQLAAVGQRLQSNLSIYEASLGSLVERCSSDVALLLGRCIDRYTQAQNAALTEAYRRNAAQVWSCDSAPLRDDLQHEFLRVYRYWESKLLQADELIRAQLRSVMPEATVPGGSIPAPKTRPRLRHPDVSALGRVVALDLSSPWWIAWWRGRPSLDSRRSELERVIRAEFEPLIQELARAAEEALGEHTHHATRQARISTVDIVDGIHKRSTDLVDELQTSGPADAATVRGLAQQLRQSEISLAQWAELRLGLSLLVEKCERMTQATPSGQIK